jgi:hypothetical protein
LTGGAFGLIRRWSAVSSLTHPIHARFAEADPSAEWPVTLVWCALVDLVVGDQASSPGSSGATGKQIEAAATAYGLYDIAHQRLLNQYFAGASFEKPDDVVSRLVAVQPQDYAGAKWALGLRLRDAHDADIDARERGRHPRTYVLRPTWHFVAPADIRWLLALVTSRVHAVNAHRYRELELTALLCAQSQGAHQSLEGGQHLTREELGEALEKAGLAEAKGQRLAYSVMHAELNGLICSGPRRGKQFTYALLEERVPPVAALARDESLAELTRRFFAGHGPATVQDFAKWSGLRRVDANAAWRSSNQLQHGR